LKPGEFNLSVGAEEHLIDVQQVIADVQEALETMTPNLQRTGTHEI
jgi:hypothetical protein